MLTWYIDVISNKIPTARLRELDAKKTDCCPAGVRRVGARRVRKEARSKSGEASTDSAL